MCGIGGVGPPIANNYVGPYVVLEKGTQTFKLQLGERVEEPFGQPTLLFFLLNKVEVPTNILAHCNVCTPQCLILCSKECTVSPLIEDKIGACRFR